MKSLSVNNKITLALIIVTFSPASILVAIMCGNALAAAILATATIKVIASTRKAILEADDSCPLSEAYQFTIEKLKKELENFDTTKPHNRRKSDQKSRATAEVRQVLYKES